MASIISTCIDVVAAAAADGKAATVVPLNAALAAQINLNHALDDGDSDSDWSD